MNMSDTNVNVTPAAAAPTGPALEVRPRVDIYENSDELLMLAEVPGASSESIGLRIEESLLTVKAQRTAANGRNIRYQRAFQVPETVDPEKISAQLKNGVLHIHLGKTDRAKPRTIAIQAT
jgi:HSP20 family protein